LSSRQLSKIRAPGCKARRLPLRIATGAAGSLWEHQSGPGEGACNDAPPSLFLFNNDTQSQDALRA
jgi:hypothetical protein